MAKTIIDARVWSPDRSGEKPYPSGYTGGSFHSRIRSLVRREILNREDSVSMELIPGPETVYQHLEHRDIVRVTFDDGDLLEFRIRNPSYVWMGNANPPYQGVGMMSDMGDYILRRMATGSGVQDIRFSVIGRSASFYLGLIADSLPFHFTAGTVTGMTSAQQARKFSMTFDGDTCLGALKKLCDELGCEYELARNTLTDRYAINLVEKVGVAGNRTIGYSASGNPQALDMVVTTNGDDYAGRVIPVIDGDDGEQLNISQVEFSYTYTGSTLTLDENIFPSDGWMVGLFVGNDVDGWWEITDQTAEDIEVSGALSLTRDTVRFAKDNTGAPLYFLRPKQVDHGDRERVIRYQGATVANELDQAGADGSMSTPGADPNLVVGFEKVGSPSVGLTSSEIHTRVGSANQFVSGARGEGIQTGPIIIQGPYVSVWLACSIQTAGGGLWLDIVDDDGNQFPAVDGKPYTISTEPEVITLERVPTEGMTMPIKIRILGTRDANLFNVDGLTVVDSAYARPWSDIMGPRDLMKQALIDLDRVGQNVFKEVVGNAIDAYLVDNLTGDQLVLGATVTVRGATDPGTTGYQLNFESRIVETVQDHTQNLTVSVRTERVQEDILDLLTAERNKVEPYPVSPGVKGGTPVVRAIKTETPQLVTYSLYVDSPSSGVELSNYEILTDHTYNGTTGEWVANGGGAFTVWDTSSAAQPHVMYIRRPNIGAPIQRIRFYVVNRDNGSRTSTQEVTSEPLSYEFSIDLGQDGQTGIITATIDDMALAMVSLHYATRPDAASDFGGWVNMNVLDDPADSGTIGASQVITRRRSFALQEGHNTLVKVRVGFQGQGVTVQYVYQTVSMDHDHIPNVSFWIEPKFDGALDKFQINLHWIGDEDTGSIEVDFAGGGFTDYVGRSGTADLGPGYVVSPGQSFTVTARGVHPNGLVRGADWVKEFTVADLAPGVKVENLVGEITVATGDLVESSRRFTSNVRWTSDDTDTIRWHGSAGPGNPFSLWIEGEASPYTIASGQFTTMVVGSVYYIYWDPDVSTTAFQVSTSIDSARGERKLLMCVAMASDDGLSGDSAFFAPAPGTLNQIRELTADEIRANVVRAIKLEAATLSVLAATTGVLEVSDTLTMGASGKIQNSAADWYVDADGFTVVNKPGADFDTPNSFKMIADDVSNKVLGGLYAAATGAVILAAADPTSLGGGYNTQPVILIATEDTGSSGADEGLVWLSSNGTIRLGAGYQIELWGTVRGNAAADYGWYPPQMTTTERDAAGLTSGALIYNTTSGRLQAKRGDNTWGDL